MSSKNDDRIWILVPLAALCIPIFAVIGDNTPLLILIGGLLALAGVVLAARSLMTHRHNLTMKELDARERITLAERAQLTEAQRILELDDRLPDLKSAVESDPQT